MSQAWFIDRRSIPPATASAAALEAVHQPHPAEAFCRTVHPQLVRAFSLAFGDRDLAEELAQESLRRVIERWESVVALDDPIGYAVRIGFNLGRSRWRSHVAEQRALARAGSTADHAEDVTAQSLAVRQAVRELPRRQREVIMNRYFLDRNVQQTADAMRCAEGTIKALTSHAVSSLRLAGLSVSDD